MKTLSNQVDSAEKSEERYREMVEAVKHEQEVTRTELCCRIDTNFAVLKSGLKWLVIGVWTLIFLTVAVNIADLQEKSIVVADKAVVTYDEVKTESVELLDNIKLFK